MNNICRLAIVLTLIVQIIGSSSAELTAFKRIGNRSTPIDSSAQYRSFPSDNGNNGDEEEDRTDSENSEGKVLRKSVNNQAKRHHRHYPYTSYFYYQQQPPNYYQSVSVPAASGNTYSSGGAPCQQQSAYSPYGYYQSASPCSATSQPVSGDAYAYGSEYYGSQLYGGGGVQQPVVMVVPTVSASGVDYGYGTGEDFYHFYPDVAWSATAAAPSSTFTIPPPATATSANAPQEAKPVETPYVGASPPPNSYVLETVLVTPNSLSDFDTLLADNNDDDDVIFKPFQLSTSQPSFALPGSGLAAGVSAKQPISDNCGSRKQFPDGLSAATKPCPTASGVAAAATSKPQNPYDQPQQWLQPQVAPVHSAIQQNGINPLEENDYHARPMIVQPPPPTTYSSQTSQKPQQPKNGGENGNNYYHRNNYHYYQQQLQQNNGQSLQYWITTTTASPSTIDGSTRQVSNQQSQAVVDSQQYWTLLQQLQQQLAQQIWKQQQQTETKTTTIGALPTTTTATTITPISATTAARKTLCQNHHSSTHHQQTLIKWRPQPSNRSPQQPQPQQNSPSVAVVASNYLEAIPVPRFQPHISSAHETNDGAWQLVKVSNDARNNRKTLAGRKQNTEKLAVDRGVVDETQSAKIKHVPERVVIVDRRSLIEFLNRPQTKTRSLSELTRIEKKCF